MVRLLLAAAATLLASPNADAFSLVGFHQNIIKSVTARSEDDALTPPQQQQPNPMANICMGAMMAAALTVPQICGAVSGGGLDYANLDLSGKDFSQGNYKGKDFTQVIAKGATFAGSNLQGCRFYKAYLVNVDFSGSDLRGASLEDTSMDGASLKNAIASGTYWSKSILDTQSVENADFTDAQFPPKVLPLLCVRDDMTGTNPVTGVDTRESAMCP